MSASSIPPGTPVHICAEGWDTTGRRGVVASGSWSETLQETLYLITGLDPARPWGRWAFLADELTVLPEETPHG